MWESYTGKLIFLLNLEGYVGIWGITKNKHHEDRRIKEWIVKIKMNVGDEGRQRTGRIQTRSLCCEMRFLPCAGFEELFWDLGL